MPEPLLYFKAIAAAAITSALVVLVMVAALRRFRNTASSNTASWAQRGDISVFAIGCGLAAGYFAFAWRAPWPPISGLDRLLGIVLPLALGIEWVAGRQRVRGWVRWGLRALLAAAIPRILLHGSVYLSGDDANWPMSRTLMMCVVCSGLLVTVWALLRTLSQRSPGNSIPLSLCLAVQSAGLTIMMAGYVKGGSAAFPLVSALLTTVIACALVDKLTTQRSDLNGAATDIANHTARSGGKAILGIAVVGLFGLLFIGHFFGRLSVGSALLTGTAPLWCWVTELPLVKHRKPWIVGTVRLMLVAIPLMVVLASAKRDFDRDLAPLLNIAVSPG